MEASQCHYTYIAPLVTGPFILASVIWIYSTGELSECVLPLGGKLPLGRGRWYLWRD